MLWTERFRQNKALFHRYISVYGVIKKQLITALEPIFMSKIKDKLAGFGQVTALEMIDNIFRAYSTIDEID